MKPPLVLFHLHRCQPRRKAACAMAGSSPKGSVPPPAPLRPDNARSQPCATEEVPSGTSPVPPRRCQRRVPALCHRGGDLQQLPGTSPSQQPAWRAPRPRHPLFAGPWAVARPHGAAFPPSNPRGDAPAPPRPCCGSLIAVPCPGPRLLLQHKALPNHFWGGGE